MTIAGIEPRTIVAPADRDELAAVVRELYAAGMPFAFVGGGTELELGNAPTSLDTVVTTTGCNRVVDYAPEDQTITVEAGMTLAAVGEVLAEHDQFIALDVPDPARTTIGGAIATNAYGRRRLRFGSVKDNIVGIGIVRADGTAARGGGKVVKNVAGFDIPKLMVGALGTLGAIVSATFRVHPRNEYGAAVTIANLTAGDVMRVCAEAMAEALVPTSIVAYDNGERYDCVVAFDGFRGGVDEQVRTMTAIAQRLRFEASTTETEPFEARERSVRCDGRWRIRLGAAPTALANFLSTPETAGLRRVYYPAIGAAFVTGDDLDAATIARWRTTLGGGTVVVAAMPRQARSSVEAWGTPPSSLPIMRRLKANFDPKGLCNPGRFVGGI
ncbi:MAG: FAD-binding oxidoreductase [Vulcanimicrobiaceae bacterium]